MSERDSYIHYREQQAKAHQVVRRVEIVGGDLEAEANKDFPHPILEISLDDLAWSKRSVENVIDAVSRGYVRATLNGDQVKIEFLPIANLPEELGQVTEKTVFSRNMASKTAVYGAPDEQFTYLQTTDFVVEGYMDDESAGQEYVRLFVDSEKLVSKRNVYLDPESLHVTDYEYGMAFALMGGIPKAAITHAEVIRARPVRVSVGENTESLSPEALEQEMREHVDRLRKFLEK